MHNQYPKNSCLLFKAQGRPVESSNARRSTNSYPYEVATSGYMKNQFRPQKEQQDWPSRSQILQNLQKEANDPCRDTTFTFINEGKDSLSHRKVTHPHYMSKPKLTNLKKIEKETKKESIMQRKIFVDRIPREVGNKDLRSAFKKYGKTEKVFIIYEEKDSVSLNKGFVVFQTSASAKSAIEDAWILVKGQKVTIQAPKTKGQKRSQKKARLREEKKRAKMRGSDKLRTRETKKCGVIQWGGLKGDYKPIVSAIQISTKTEFGRNHNWWGANLVFRRGILRV